MHSSGFALGLLAGCALLACGGSDESGSAQGAPEGEALHWSSGPLVVPPGESFECFYTDIKTPAEISVLSASAKQGLGGHHVSVYYVDTERPVAHSACSGTTEMVDWHFVVGAGGEGNDLSDFASLSEGLAIKIPEGKQLLVQTHYINATGKEQNQTDELVIHLADPSTVKAYAADFVVLDEAFEIPPKTERYTHESTCTVKDDLQLAMLIGHMHEQGVRYLLESVDEHGATLETYYDEEWFPAYASHPPVLKYTMDAPFLIKAGTVLHQKCEWKNPHDESLLFPTEMCIGFGYYFPGTERIMCEQPK